MAFDWIKEKASSALQSVGSVGTSLLESAKGLVSGDSKPETKSDKPADKPEEKSEKKEEKPSASLLAEASLVEAAKRQISKERQGQSPSLCQTIKSANVTINAISAIADTVCKTAPTGTLETTALVAGSMLGPLGTAVAGAAIGLKKISENTWETQDEKIKVARVSGEATTTLRDDFESLWSDLGSVKASAKNDSDKVTPLEITGIDNKPSAKDAASVTAEALAFLMADELPTQTHTTTDSKGNKTTSEVTPEGVSIKKTDSTGNVVTEVEKKGDTTTVRHLNETAKRKNGSTIFEKPGIKVITDEAGNRKVLLGEDQELVRNADGTATLMNKKTGTSFKVSEGQMRAALQSGNPVIFGSKSADLDALTDEIRKGLKDGQTGLLVLDGIGTRTVFHDGTVMDIKGDKTARILTATGDLFVIDADKKVRVRHNGEWYDLSHNRRQGLVNMVDGKFDLGILKIDVEQGKVETATMRVDVASGVQQIQGKDNVPGQESTVTTNEQGKTTVESGNTRMTNDTPGGTVQITTTPEAGDPNSPAARAQTVEINLDTQEFITDAVTDTKEMTVINETGTEILADGTVNFTPEQGGPVLHRDGSVKVDKETEMDADGKVTSGGWSSSPALVAESVVLTKRANLASADVQGKVASVLAKSVVRWSDIQELNGALGDISAMLAQIPPSSPLFAKLKEAYTLVTAAIAQAQARANHTDRLEQARKQAA